jgi:transcription elongation factor Elf1
VNFEKITYYCPHCGQKGFISDVFINPTVLIVNGHCNWCAKRSGVRAIDLLELAQRIDSNEPYKPEPKMWGRSRYTADVIP